MILHCFIIISAAALLCDGQIAEYLFPELTQATRGVVDELTKTPLVSRGSQSSGDLLSAGVRVLTLLPEAATRALGVGTQLPGLLPDSHTNIFGALDNFLPDYDAGLGNEDATLDIRDIVRKYGYTLEEHEVVTEDDYILSVFRIPSNGSAVFLMHGLLGSADDYVVAGPENGLAYLLADEGYDVWMGNARGTKHSRRHVHLKPSEAKFWDFSWHEIGTLDLPAMIDSVLEETTAKSLKYIGHSQGTTTFFVLTSVRPEYNEKVSLMVALSPVAFMTNVRSPVVRLLAAGTPFIHGFLKAIGVYEFLPDSSLMRTLKLLMCGAGVVSDIMCSNIMFMMAGVGYAQFNFTNLPVLMGHTPAGASAKQVAHYGQGVLTGEFRHFDYGTAGNLERYGTETPPSYALENIVAPISLFYSDADWLAHPKDVDKLYNNLDSAIDIHKIPYQQFNHLDFLWAKDFKVLVYKRLRKLLTFF
ncbi:Lipase 3 [Operophtera brumata]|uniref:Lipase 3 n=1 Tax=Operophtera brumata TaxID=104452 RepID=A0A0L7LE27_OPEBR|nr:Lipase 3 [Operophtera brumata]